MRDTEAVGRTQEVAQRVERALRRQHQEAVQKAAEIEKGSKGRVAAYERGVAYGFSVAANAVQEAFPVSAAGEGGG